MDDYAPESSVEQNTFDTETSSADSLIPPHRETIQNIPPLPIGAPTASSPTEKDDARVRAPSQEEILCGGRSIAVLKQHLAEMPSQLSTSMSQSGEVSPLISKQFYEEMNQNGILGVERIQAMAESYQEDVQTPRENTLEAATAQDAASSGKSPVSGVFTQSTEKISPSQQQNHQSLLTRENKLAPLDSSYYQAAGELAEEFHSPTPRKPMNYPPPPPTPPSPLNSTRTVANDVAQKCGKPDFHLEPGAPSGDFNTKSRVGVRNFFLTETTLPATSFTVQLPKLAFAGQKKAIPVTRLLEEEGRSVVSEEAVKWRERCMQLTELVNALQKEVRISAPQEHTPQVENSGGWRQAGNGFRPSRTKNAGVNQDEEGDRAASKASVRLNSVSQRTKSVSFEPRSISPQSPNGAELFPTIEMSGKESYHQEMSSNNLMHLNDAVPFRGYVLQPPGNTMPTEESNKSSQTNDADDGKTNVAQTENIASDVSSPPDNAADDLVFVKDDCASKSSKAAATGGNCHRSSTDDFSNEDNLYLVLVEKKAREYKQSLQKSVDEAEVLRKDVERIRLQRDELETQLLSKDEKLFLQQEEYETRIHALEEEVARQRANIEDGSAKLPIHNTAKERLENLLKSLSSHLTSGEMSAEGINACVEAVDEAKNVLEKFPVSTEVPATASAISDAHLFMDELRGLSQQVANIANSTADGVSSDSATMENVPASELLSGVQRSVEVIRELIDTQGVQTSELREELEVVRKDRNALIGQQSEQVRQLQEELLAQENSHLRLMEKHEEAQAQLAQAHEENETLRHQMASLLTNNNGTDSGSASEGDKFDAEAFAEKMREQFEVEKREACAELEESLRDLRTRSESAQRAQHNVFAERLSAAQEQLHRSRVAASEEKEKHKSQIVQLRKELEAAKADLRAKEVALSIALREDIRQPLDMQDQDASDSSEVDEKITHDRHAISLSRSSYGMSTADWATATHRTSSGSVSAGARSRASSELLTTDQAMTMPRLAHSQSPGSSVAVASIGGRSPSPIFPPPTGGADDRLHSPPSWATAAADHPAAPQSFSMPARLAPELRVAPAIMKPAMATGHATATAAPRKVTFVGVSPLTPSPDARSAVTEGGVTSPIPMATLDASSSGWLRASSSSPSSSLAYSPNAAFVQEGSGMTTPVTATALKGEQLSLVSSDTGPAASSPLRPRTPSAANTSDGGGDSSAKKRSFVKMGSLQRMREIWARQESLLLGSSSLSPSPFRASDVSPTQ